ncbi:uncharacterized protein VTP21DRAFT_2098 [Calcarisporiella thermophila]|uniref:uncharacterized protein n=1 Tax=Calcarisporiella thermophila TaxID=911321 RepID=UPI0037446638
MVFINGTKYACATCIKGHRSTQCHHADRPLYEIRRKGRPLSQCQHCRELRKNKQLHIKCNCNDEPALPFGILGLLPIASSNCDHNFTESAHCSCYSARHNLVGYDEKGAPCYQTIPLPTDSSAMPQPMVRNQKGDLSESGTPPPRFGMEHSESPHKVVSVPSNEHNLNPVFISCTLPSASLKDKTKLEDSSANLDYLLAAQPRSERSSVSAVSHDGSGDELGETTTLCSNKTATVANSTNSFAIPSVPRNKAGHIAELPSPMSSPNEQLNGWIGPSSAPVSTTSLASVPHAFAYVSGSASASTTDLLNHTTSYPTAPPTDYSGTASFCGSATSEGEDADMDNDTPAYLSECEFALDEQQRAALLSELDRTCSDDFLSQIYGGYSNVQRDTPYAASSTASSVVGAGDERDGEFNDGLAMKCTSLDSFECFGDLCEEYLLGEQPPM